MMASFDLKELGTFNLSMGLLTLTHIDDVIFIAVDNKSRGFYLAQVELRVEKTNLEIN